MIKCSISKTHPVASENYLCASGVFFVLEEEYSMVNIIKCGFCHCLNTGTWFGDTEYTGFTWQGFSSRAVPQGWPL